MLSSLSALIFFTKAVAMPSAPDQRRAAFESAQDEARNAQQKAILLSEVSAIWANKCVALLRHSSELLRKSRELRRRSTQGAAKKVRKAA
jgi:hypothetical protein